jgi:porphyrinogen peroxidase
VEVAPGGEDVVRDLLPDVPALQRAVGFRVPDGFLTCVVGIGAEVWPRLFGVDPPAGLHPFRELRGPRHTAPSTKGDLLFHLRATEMDLCFEMAGQLMNRLAGAATVVDEVHGFKYFEMRDLLGFVDGTENPTDDDARTAAIVGPDGGIAADGSYVIVQKYLHDLTAWNSLSTEAQEQVVGRSKLTDVEQADKAPNSHVALNTVEDPDGNELKILRDNMPFGSVKEGEFGTYYIAYAATPDVPELMLRRMFLGDPYGTYDRILDFSTAVTGSLFFVPSADFLDSPPAFSALSADPADVPVSDGSLQIGSLKRSPAQ